MRDARARSSVAAAALLAAACASHGGAAGAAAAAAPLAPPAIAPALGVDFAAMRTTPSGVYVRDLRVGSGATAVGGAMVQVRYRGWLADGTPVDSTAASDAPVSFRLGRGAVIRGWDEAIPGMRVGGQRQLVIRPQLGYGRKGTGPIPPNATLVFTIDLVAAR
ncbi:MAG: FKBP-type peptidyl-prolyl cis-trans isomerase [Gemmatirosa sp.]|nr:FKBP-type peptidyl-prolyl cis-trans isomerase [Gemmatirosa sp.]